MSVTPITSLSQFRELINGDKPIIVDFWAEWCGPCRLISPTYESIAKKVGANVGFYKVDVDTQSEISEEVGIRAMPTFIVFRKGEKKHELVGASPPRLEELINNARRG